MGDSMNSRRIGLASLTPHSDRSHDTFSESC